MIWTKGLAKQLAKRGIRVNAVAPGPIWTPLQVTGGQEPDKLPKFGADTPMGRPGQPAELAPLYVLLSCLVNKRIIFNWLFTCTISYLVPPPASA